MKRLETETFEDYKKRRKETNLIEGIRRRGCMLWMPELQGQKEGKFKDKESFILNDLFTYETIRKDLISKKKIKDDSILETINDIDEAIDLVEKVDEIETTL